MLLIESAQESISKNRGFSGRCASLNADKSEDHNITNSLVADDLKAHNSVQDDDDFFVVFMHNEVLAKLNEEMLSIEAEAENLANTLPGSDPVDRSFNTDEVNKFFQGILEGNQIQIIGFNEFPYSRGGQLSGNDRLIEREYWVKDKLDKDKNRRVLLHIHYEGKWKPYHNQRDRSVIAAINLRHSVPKKCLSSTKVFHLKCRAENQWRESGKYKIPLATPWAWERDAHLHPALYKLLKEAEKCCRRVRTLADPGQVEFNVVPGHRRALILSVERYADGGIVDLPNANIDGANLLAALRRLGWDVTFRADAGLDDAENEIARFADSASDNRDACLLAFIGHGLECNGVLYLVPRDALLRSSEYANREVLERKLQRQCLSFQAIEEQFAARRDGRAATLFVLDCCRNSFGHDVRTPTRSILQEAASTLSAGRRVSAVRNSIVIFSTSAGSVASDGPQGEGGPFINALARAIATPGLDLDEVLMRTRAQVARASSSCQLAPSTSLLTRRFYFCAGPPKATGGPMGGSCEEGRAADLDAGSGSRVPAQEMQLAVTRGQLEVERARLEAERARGAAALELCRAAAERERAEADRERRALTLLEYEARGLLDWRCRHCGKAKDSHFGPSRTRCLVSGTALSVWEEG